MRYDTQAETRLQDSSEAGDDSVSECSTVTGGVRSTLCVSSQVGCQMGCKFCATGVSLSVFR